MTEIDRNGQRRETGESGDGDWEEERRKEKEREGEKGKDGFAPVFGCRVQLLSSKVI